MKGIIDRFVDEKWAVLLVGENEIEYNIPLEKLPMSAKEGSIVQVELENDRIKNIVVFEEETTREQERIKDKLHLLRSRTKSNFKR